MLTAFRVHWCLSFYLLRHGNHHPCQFPQSLHTIGWVFPPRWTEQVVKALSRFSDLKVNTIATEFQGKVWKGILSLINQPILCFVEVLLCPHGCYPSVLTADPWERPGYNPDAGSLFPFSACIILLGVRTTTFLYSTYKKTVPVTVSLPSFSCNFHIYDLFLYFLATLRTLPTEETLSGPATWHVSCVMCVWLMLWCVTRRSPGLSLKLCGCHLDILHCFSTSDSTFSLHLQIT